MKVVFHPLFLFVVIIAFWQGLGFYLLACILAVLIHESSHALAARYYGVRASRITLLPFGAAINLDCAFLPRKFRMAILLSGALGNIFASIFAGALLWLVPDLFFALGMFIVANMTIAVMNLLPLYPLDSGKIIELFHNRFITRLLHIFSNLVFFALFIVACFVIKSFGIVLFAICMLFTINTESKSEYVVKLSEILDIIYNTEHEKKSKNQTHPNI